MLQTLGPEGGEEQGKEQIQHLVWSFDFGVWDFVKFFFGVLRFFFGFLRFFLGFCEVFFTDGFFEVFLWVL